MLVRIRGTKTWDPTTDILHNVSTFFIGLNTYASHSVYSHTWPYHFFHKCLNRKLLTTFVRCTSEKESVLVIGWLVSTKRLFVCHM